MFQLLEVIPFLKSVFIEKRFQSLIHLSTRTANWKIHACYIYKKCYVKKALAFIWFLKCVLFLFSHYSSKIFENNITNIQQSKTDVITEAQCLFILYTIAMLLVVDYHNISGKYLTVMIKHIFAKAEKHGFF